LLPGRGAPGFGAAGRGDTSAAGATGSSGACGGSSAGVTAGISVSSRVGGASTEGGADRGSVVGVSMGAGADSAAGATGASAAAIGSFAGAFFAAFLAALSAASVFHSSPRSLVRRATTGGSTVEDADLTNSPMSFSAARTSLLGTPNSFASSWTLALATILLLGRSEPEEGGPLVVGRAHRMILIEMS
jgi:hypothetical protein